MGIYMKIYMGIYNHTNIYIYYIYVKHIWYIITSGMIFGTRNI